MAQLIVRDIEESVKVGLQRRARRHGHSTEEEVRTILRNAVHTDQGASVPLGTRLKNRFAGIGLKNDIIERRGRKARPAVFKP